MTATMTAPAPGAAVAVNPADIEVRAELVAGLPVVSAVLERLGFDELVASYLPEPDPRCELDPALAIGVLVRNLALGRQPLYGLGAWAAGYDPALLGLPPGQPAQLNADRAGRALDELFLADRASMTTRLSLAAVAAYGISADELHNDSTSLALYGAYQDAGGIPRGGATPPRPARGHSKDHRPDLKQLVWILTISADGAVPVTCRMADGNTEDSTTHIATGETCRALAGRAGFLYVADCKLATRDNMRHIAGQHGRFLTVLPRSRREDQAARAELAAALAAPRCRLRHRVAVEEAAAAVIAEAGATRWVRFEVADEVTAEYRQERRGRPGPGTRYRRIDRHRFTLSFTVNAAAVAYDAASDGCFPLVTNDTEMTAAELLAACKRQPRLERRHATFKGVLEAAPIELKSDYRIDALGFCLYAALLVHALIERQLRSAMADAGLAELPLYHEDRPCKTPTAARVLELLSPLARTIVLHRDQVLKVAPPALSPLQEKILTLLGVPLSPYRSGASPPRNST